MLTNFLEMSGINAMDNRLRKSIAAVFCQNQTLGASVAKSAEASSCPTSQFDITPPRTSPPARNTAIDLLKILAILGVVVFHSCAPFFDGGKIPEMRIWLMCYAFQSIFVFCVPIFVMCSGAMLLSSTKSMAPLSFYKKRLPKIIIPLIVWSVVYYVYKVDPTHLTTADIPRFLKQFFSATVVAHLWFLYMLIGIYLSAPFLQMLLQMATRSQQWLFVILALGLPAVQIALSPILELNIGLSYSIFSYYVGYFILGHLLQTAKPASGKGCLGLLGIFLVMVLSTFFMQWYIHSSDFKTHFFLINHPMINVVIMSAALFMLFRSMSFVWLAPLGNFIGVFATATYGIYLVHLLARFLLKVGILGIPITPLAFNPVVGVLLTSLGMLFVSFVMVYVLSKIPYLRQSVGYGRSTSAK
jgi:surface polysaccharide O-acyltransferase-like enzyme